MASKIKQTDVDKLFLEKFVVPRNENGSNSYNAPVLDILDLTGDDNPNFYAQRYEQATV